MDVLILKAHLVSAAVSLLFYFIRGGMMLVGAAALNARILLAIVSMIAIVLFASGVFMGFNKHLSFADGFMLSKIIGFLLYISLGVIAFKKGLSKPVAIILWLLGLASFLYTYLIATHKLTPFFA